MINKAILIGNCGKDPEIRTTSAGKKVATFSLATSDNRKNDKGEKVTTTMWHNIVAWSPLAEVMESYVKKGQQLYIEGRINYRDYTDKDGNKRYITEIVANTIQMVGAKKQDEPKPSATYPDGKQPASISDVRELEDDQPPF